MSEEDNKIDIAFGNMIARSEELLDIGRPRVKFSALRPCPKRLECDLAAVSVLGTPGRPLSDRAFSEYSALLGELKRFEPGVLLFTSAEPGQGVSFTAHNIARLWSDDGTQRILLVEFYNGESGLPYELPHTEGAQLVRQPQDIEQYMRRCPHSGLYLLSCHAPGATGFTGEPWLRISSTFDLVIIDCSPFWHNALAARLAPMADGVALVAARAPELEVITRFEKELREGGANFMGVIMNSAAAETGGHEAVA